MFKLFRAARPSGGENAAAPRLVVRPHLLIAGRLCAAAALLFAVGFEHALRVYARPLFSARPEHILLGIFYCSPTSALFPVM